MESNFLFSDKKPLYNIRIIRSYINYLQKKYPKIDTNELLLYAGITKLQYNDDGYWYNQKQANQLHQQHQMV